MAAAPKTSALAARLAPDLAAMAAVTDAAPRASAKATLATKCPRFTPSDTTPAPLLSAAAQMRKVVEGLPASVEVTAIPLGDGGVYYEFRRAQPVAAQVMAA